jgi:putative SOS response-associated peptidase YedK
LPLTRLWSEWIDEETGGLNTFSTVIAKENKILAIIHNNPKIEGLRKSIILEQELDDNWLNPFQTNLI